MIEGEEVLESAQETGYRLCVAPGEVDETEGEWSKIFSAQWDPCLETRLYVCSQRGQLRAYNVEDGSYRTYRILFRKHSSDFSDLLEDGRPVAYHWDKMVAIPERPDELVFLLGVSKNLMYTALPGTVPYPEEPFISSTGRGDFTGYIYGTPVMELWSHVARITCVSVNTTGQILASGDEQGNLKLLVLRLLDNLIITQKSAKEQKKSSANVPTFSNFIPEYKLTMRAHTHGPIFAMQWLPMPTLPPKGSDEDRFNIARRTRYYCLATGSQDCAVRVWGVTCSVTKGLTIAPVMVLDTLNTQVLSLHGYLHMTKPTAAEDLLKKQQIRQRLSDKANANLPFEIPDPSNMYLAAGTHTGAIYIWKIDTKSAFNTVVALDTALTGGVTMGGRLDAVNPPRLIDDGTKLHSLLQSSDRPIISITLSTCKNPNLGVTAPRKVCLVAVDSSSVVRSHRESDHQADMDGADDGSTAITAASRRSSGGMGSPKKSRGPGSVLSASGLAQPASSLAKYPVVLCGEASFPGAMVVCASYQERAPLPAHLGEDMTASEAFKAVATAVQTDTWILPDTDGKTKRTSRLLIGTSEGQLHVVDSDGVFFDKDKAAVAASVTDDINALMSRLRGSGGESEAQSAAGARGRVAPTATPAASVAPPVFSRTGPPSSSASVVASEASYASVGGARAGAGSGSGSGSLPLAAAGGSSSRGAGPIIANQTLPPAPITASASRTTAAAAANVTRPRDSSTVPAPALPPAPPKVDVQFSSASATPPLAPAPTPAPRDVSPQPRPQPQAPALSPSKQAPEGDRTARRVTVVEPEEKRSAPSAPAAAGGGSSRAASAAVSAQAAAARQNAPHPAPAVATKTKAKIPSPINRPAGPSSSTARKVGGKGRSGAAADSRSDGSDSDSENDSRVPNPYQIPTLNSSAALQQQLRELSHKLDSDLVSVQSESTTTSARLSAAGVVNVPTHADRYSREGLTPVLDPNDLLAQYHRSAPKKQVDADWVRRKQHNGPAPQDLAPLVTPDPVVRLRATHNQAATVPEGASGLSVGHDEDTLLPLFSLCCPADRAFGGSVGEEWAERGAMQAALMLDLVSL